MRLERFFYGCQSMILPRETEYEIFGQHRWSRIGSVVAVTTVGQGSLILLLATIELSKSITKRNPLLVNLLVFALCFSVSPLLLFYTGNVMNFKPPKALCLAQASIKHGTDTAFVVAPLCLVIDLFWSTRILVHKSRIPAPTRFMILVGPYVFGTIWMICTAVLGGIHPDLVGHLDEDLYCVVNIFWFGRGVEAFAVSMDLATIILEVCVLIRLRRMWPSIKRLTDGNTSINVSLIFRMGVLTGLQLLYLIGCAFAFVPRYGPRLTEWNDIWYPAIVPLATFLIFGTTRTYLRIWMFWRRPKSTRTEAPIEVQLDRPTSAFMDLSRNKSLPTTPTSMEVEFI